MKSYVLWWPVAIVCALFTFWLSWTMHAPKGTPKQVDDVFGKLSREENEELQRTCGKVVYKEMVMNASGRRAAEEGQFPSAVRVVIADVDIPAYLQKMCTGHVISLRHILIAAHCLQFSHTGIRNTDVRNKFVAYGGSACIDLRQNEKCVRSGTERPRRLKIKSLVIAEEAVTLMVMSSYEGTLYDAESKAEATDFAMLELETPVSVSDPYIRPICLPRPDQQLPIEYRRLGFGAIEQSNEANSGEQLQFIDSRELTDLEKCSQTRSSAKSACALNYIAFHNTSSDAPLDETFADGGMVGSVAGRQILFGILSILNGKWTRTESYDVATKLSARHDFICFYSGVCPMGYNNFTDRDYADHPQIGTVVQNGYGNYSLGDDIYCLLKLFRQFRTYLFIVLSRSPLSLARPFQLQNSPFGDDFCKLS